VVLNAARRSLPPRVSSALTGRIRSQTGVKLRIASIGRVDETQGVDCLLSALDRLPESVGAVICGPSADNEFAAHVRERVAEPGFRERCVVAGRVPRSEASTLTSLCQLGTVIYSSGEVAADIDACPNKIGDYLRHGLGILGSDQEYVARLVNGYGVGTVLKRLTPETLTSAIGSFLQPDRLDRVRARSSRLFHDFYNMDSQAAGFLTFLRGLKVG
jgi:glycosyltransferase involved in cell wall biosynthesis